MESHLPAQLTNFDSYTLCSDTFSMIVINNDPSSVATVLSVFLVTSK